MVCANLDACHVLHEIEEKKRFLTEARRIL